MDKIEKIYKKYGNNHDFLMMNNNVWEFLKDYSKQLLEFAGKSNATYDPKLDVWFRQSKFGTTGCSTEDFISEFNNSE